MKVSLFEISYKKKLTFSPYTFFLQMYLYICTYGQTSPNLIFLLEITNAVSFGLKRRETFPHVISVQLKSQHPAYPDPACLAPPKQPTHSRLDEWFLPGRSQAPCQWATPFFPEDHSELTKSWHAPYSACLSSNSCSALSSVDGTEEKGYEKMPPLNEAVTAHLCLPTAFGWKAKVAHPSNPCRRTSALAGRAYSSAGQTASRPCMSQDLTPAAFRYFLVNWKVIW